MELFATFLEGLLSFLSPCVLPLIPLYMAYLSNGASTKDEEGNVHYNQLTVFLRTLFFVFGILLAIGLMAISVDVIRDYIADYQDIIAIAGSVLILIFGLHETGLIEINILNKEFTLKNRLNLKGMNFLKAFVFGFLFAFAWSPCIGPMLSSALLLAISSQSGILYLVAYGLGFVIPFIICGLATGFVLNLIRKHQKVFRYVNIISGVILIGFAVYMFVNASNNIVNIRHYEEEKVAETATESSNEEQENSIHYVDETVYYDQDGNEICLTDYKDKFLFVNYIATWCTYCVNELPDFEEFCDSNDVGCLLVMSPDANGGDVSDIKDFYEYYNLHTPILVDSENTLLYFFGISSYPTTWVIGPDSSVLGYHTGALDLEGFNYVLSEAGSLFEAR